MSAVSLDHLVSGGQQSFRDCKAERLGGLHVDDQFERGRLHDWKVGGLGAFEDLTRVGANLMIRVREFGSVAHQPASFNQLAVGKGRSDSVARRESGKLNAPA